MDWDNDGTLDILSGCYWSADAKAGYIHLLRGNGKLDFSAAELVKNADGNPLQNTEVSQDTSGSGMADNQTETICTEQHAVDYDDDGDLDLVVGCFAHSFYYYENSGSATQPALSADPIRLPITSTGYHSAPHLTDWDGDGDLDFLSGSSQGGVLIAENIGTRSQPDWSEFKQLLPTSTARSQDSDDVLPAPSTRVWATDWNNDGKMDLLVGDSVTLNTVVEEESEGGEEEEDTSSSSPKTESKRTGHVWLYVRE